MEDKEKIARLAFRGKIPAAMVEEASVAFVVFVAGARTNALGMEVFCPAEREMGKMRSAGTTARGPVKNVAVRVTLKMPVIFTLSVRFHSGMEGLTFAFVWFGRSKITFWVLFQKYIRLPVFSL